MSTAKIKCERDMNIVKVEPLEVHSLSPLEEGGHDEHFVSIANENDMEDGRSDNKSILLNREEDPLYIPSIKHEELHVMDVVKTENELLSESSCDESEGIDVERVPEVTLSEVDERILYSDSLNFDDEIHADMTDISPSSVNVPKSKGRKSVSTELNLRNRGRRRWDPEAMASAVDAVRRHEMGYLKASKVFAVPTTTLKRLVKKQNLSPENVAHISLGRRPILSQEIEDKLKQYIVAMQQRNFKFASTQVRELAFQIAEQNGISHTFNKDEKRAGKDWALKFFSRNPDIALQSHEPKSTAWLSDHNRDNIRKFYDLLESEMHKHKYTPERIFSVHDKAVTADMSVNSKIIDMKGMPSDQGKCVSVLLCASASGSFIPPLFVYPRKNMKSKLTTGAPHGSIFTCHPSGRVQLDSFTKWFQHFINFVKPSNEEPVMLLLNGHAAHVRNLEVFDLAQKHCVFIMSLPPFTTIRMQPLEAFFIKSLKTSYETVVETWLKDKDSAISTNEVTRLFGEAYIEAANSEAAVKGFQKTGISPFDRNVFPDLKLI